MRPRTPRRLARSTLAVAALLVLAGCAGYEPKEFTADDRCRDCATQGGILTGEDGVFRYDF